MRWRPRRFGARMSSSATSATRGSSRASRWSCASCDYDICGKCGGKWYQHGDRRGNRLQPISFPSAPAPATLPIDPVSSSSSCEPAPPAGAAGEVLRSGPTQAPSFHRDAAPPMPVPPHASPPRRPHAATHGEDPVSSSSSCEPAPPAGGVAGEVLGSGAPQAPSFHRTAAAPPMPVPPHASPPRWPHAATLAEAHQTILYLRGRVSHLEAHATNSRRASGGVRASKEQGLRQP